MPNLNPNLLKTMQVQQMNKNTNKENPTINVATTNKPAPSCMPLLNLSMTDKMYLAVSRQYADNLHYIYTLFCRENRPNNYNMIPETEIATFQDATQADVYYNTVLKIKEFQSHDEVHKALSGFADISIADFQKRTR